jgi:sulfatase maturation enzyme AslB (radical SAM superfamily)
MCTRNIHGGLVNSKIKITNWTLEEYKTIISKEVLNQLEVVYFCGNYGDPLLNNDLISMVRYSKEINENIEIRIHTNGSLRSTEWWKELANSMPKKGSVIFAIDGLEDTHSIYRIGTSYKKIIENSTAFINAGGNAKWAFIRFKHNEHQVDEARSIAKNLGFTEFSLKDSSRWLLEPKFDVLDKDGNTIYQLEKSQYSPIKIIDSSIIKNYKSIVEKTEVDCFAQHVKEAYIDAYRHVFPCCWIAMIPYHPSDRESGIQEIRYHIDNEYVELLKSLGGYDALDATKKPVKDIIESNEYQTVWQQYWDNKKLITCARTCGKAKELFSTPKDQFTETENL